jgi:hypothetical protein
MPSIWREATESAVIAAPASEPAGGPATPAAPRWLVAAFGAQLLARLLYPFFNSPFAHLFSDPQRHWDNAARFLHPSLMGSIDPLFYQVWLFALRGLAQGSEPTVLVGCGLLCAAMPYGWYRCLRELCSQRRALQGALLIGAVPETLGIYGYFMNETLLLTLLPFAFWASLRAHRSKTRGAFAGAVLLWLCAAFTRTLALPMALGCLGFLWLTQRDRAVRALVAVGCGLLFLVPAAWHSQLRLHFFAPFGNLYFTEIYSASGRREIEANFGRDGSYHFGCPSFYNPSFYPFSPWTTDRTGVVSIAVDLTQGRAPWLAERARVTAERSFPRGRQRLEDTMYLLFGQSWPNSDRSGVVGWLTVWTRWLWPVLIGLAVAALARRRYRGIAHLLPICAAGSLGLLLLQNEGVMEARFREPLDPLLVAAVVLIGVQPRTRSPIRVSPPSP